MTYEPNRVCRFDVKNVHFFKYRSENGDWSDGSTNKFHVNTRVVAIDLNKPQILKPMTVPGLAVWSKDLDFARAAWTEITYEEAVERVGNVLPT